jgi:hypothetical protein
MMMDKKFPIICPSCESELKAQSLFCDSCKTSISGLFELPLLLKLDPKEQDFIIDFVKSSGSLKNMAQNLKLSYPSVRNMLDDLISKITELQKNQQ